MESVEEKQCRETVDLVVKEIRRGHEVPVSIQSFVLQFQIPSVCLDPFQIKATPLMYNVENGV